jgi:hypothetical protein
MENPKVTFTSAELESSTVLAEDYSLKFYSVQAKPKIEGKIPYTVLMNQKLKLLFNKGNHTFPCSFKPSGRSTLRGYAKCQHGNKIVFFCEIAKFHLGGDLDLTIDCKCGSCGNTKYDNNKL